MLRISRSLEHYRAQPPASPSEPPCSPCSSLSQHCFTKGSVCPYAAVTGAENGRRRHSSKPNVTHRIRNEPVGTFDLSVSEDPKLSMLSSQQKLNFRHFNMAWEVQLSPTDFWLYIHPSLQLPLRRPMNVVSIISAGRELHVFVRSFAGAQQHRM